DDEHPQPGGIGGQNIVDRVRIIRGECGEIVFGRSAATQRGGPTAAGTAFLTHVFHTTVVSSATSMCPRDRENHRRSTSKTDGRPPPTPMPSGRYSNESSSGRSGGRGCRKPNPSMTGWRREAAPDCSCAHPSARGCASSSKPNR